MKPRSASSARPGDLLPTEAETWLCFSVAGEELAVSAGTVQEVAFGKDLEEDARAPQEILGVLPLHRRRIPVLNLAAYFQSAAGAHERHYVVVVQADGRWIGLPAAEVKGLVKLSLELMRPLPPSARQQSSEEILGAYPWEDRWLMLLDVEQLVRRASA